MISNRIASPVTLLKKVLSNRNESPPPSSRNTEKLKTQNANQLLKNNITATLDLISSGELKDQGEFLFSRIKSLCEYLILNDLATQTPPKNQQELIRLSQSAKNLKTDDLITALFNLSGRDKTLFTQFMEAIAPVCNHYSGVIINQTLPARNHRAELIRIMTAIQPFCSDDVPSHKRLIENLDKLNSGALPANPQTQPSSTITMQQAREILTTFKREYDDAGQFAAVTNNIPALMNTVLTTGHVDRAWKAVQTLPPDLVKDDFELTRLYQDALSKSRPEAHPVKKRLWELLEPRIQDALNANSGEALEAFFTEFANTPEKRTLLLNLRNPAGDTILHIACFKGKKKAIDYLKNNGADLKAENALGEIPYDVALKHKKTAGFKDSFIDTLLPETIGKVNLGSKKVALTATALRRFLDKNPKNIDARVKDSGKTVLHLAAAVGNRVFLHYVLSLSPNINITDNQGKRPIDDASDAAIRDILKSHEKTRRQTLETFSRADKPAYSEGKTIGKGGEGRVVRLKKYTPTDKKLIDPSKNYVVKIMSTSEKSTMENRIRHAQEIHKTLRDVNALSLALPVEVFINTKGEFCAVYEQADCDGMDIAEKQWLRLDNDEGQKAMAGLIVQLAEGVGVIAGNNIVHRDLKPENLLIYFKEGRVRIADFGLAAKLQNDPFLFDNVGTPGYLSPESGVSTLGIPSDRYAMGRLLLMYLPGMASLQNFLEITDLLSHMDVTIPPLSFHSLLMSPSYLETFLSQHSLALISIFIHLFPGRNPNAFNILCDQVRSTMAQYRQIFDRISCVGIGITKSSLLNNYQSMKTDERIYAVIYHCLADVPANRLTPDEIQLILKDCHMTPKELAKFFEQNRARETKSLLQSISS